MGHFAKVKDEKVIQVIVADQDFIDNMGVETVPGQWIKCSYNTKGGIHYDPATGEPSADQSKALRKNMPGIGFTYDATRDAFIPPKPRDPFNRERRFNSWVLDEATCRWKAPVDIPSDAATVPYRWDEDNGEWVQMTAVDTP